MSRFLDPADVEKLTGKKRPSAQLRWCMARGIQAWLSGANRVVIPLAAIEGTRKSSNDEDWSPDFSSCRKRA